MRAVSVPHNNKHHSTCSDDVSMLYFCQLHGLLFENVTTTMVNALMQMIGVKNGDRWLDVVDFGCGSGYSIKQFRSLSSHILGIDISPVSIENAMISHFYDELKV